MRIYFALALVLNLITAFTAFAQKVNEVSLVTVELVRPHFDSVVASDNKYKPFVQRMTDAGIVLRSEDLSYDPVKGAFSARIHIPNGMSQKVRDDLLTNYPVMLGDVIGQYVMGSTQKYEEIKEPFTESFKDRILKRTNIELVEDGKNNNVPPEDGSVQKHHSLYAAAPCGDCGAIVDCGPSFGYGCGSWHFHRHMRHGRICGGCGSMTYGGGDCVSIGGLVHYSVLSSRGPTTKAPAVGDAEFENRIIASAERLLRPAEAATFVSHQGTAASPRNTELGEVLAGEARHLYWQRNYQESLAMLEQAISQDEHSASAWYFAGLCHRALGNAPSAEAAFAKAVAYYPTDSVGTRRMSQILERVQGTLRMQLENARLKIRRDRVASPVVATASR